MKTVDKTMCCPTRRGHDPDTPTPDRWYVYEDSYYYCSHCGSMHPKDFLKWRHVMPIESRNSDTIFLKKGAQLELKHCTKNQLKMIEPYLTAWSYRYE